MSYDYYGPGLGALGFSDPRGTCAEVSNGETRCFRQREAGAARSRDCRSLTRQCEVGGDDGTMYCCPQFGTTRAPGTAPSWQQDQEAEEPTTIIGEGWEWFREVLGAKGRQGSQDQPAPMPGATIDGKPSAEGFSAYAREAAIRETAAVEEEHQAPIQEAPDDSSSDEQDEERSWIERYQTHITLVSTVIGLGTFIVWLMVRKKD